MEEFLEKIKDYFELYKTKIIIGGVFILITLISSGLIYYLSVAKVGASNVNEVSEIILEEKKETVEEKEVELEELYKVDIKGAVKKPGVYELKKGSRIIDVINKAGGLSADKADTSVTNLSKYITDEMVIVIYTKEEVKEFSKVLEEQTKKEEQCIIYNEVIVNDSCKSDNEEAKEDITNNEVDVKVSINTASLELLTTIPGIGESKAKSIIAYREEKGKFNKIEDILNVSGIGDSLFEKIKDYITV